MQIKKIHVIFKTHLDVGFTDFAKNITANYFEHYIPNAIDMAKKMRLAEEKDRFIWTTGSWLIYEYLEQASQKKRKVMEEAIAAGDITWHGLPFTTHSELMDVDLFRFGLSLSQELDRRFCKCTIAAKFSDVPGHTLGIVPLMAEAGILFLHIGVNPASTPPDVPPIFVWRSPQGSDLVVMYHKGAYGGLMSVPGMEDAIYFAHTSDNLGPQSPDQIKKIFTDLRRRFPGVEIIGSTLDAFAIKLTDVKEHLPVITQELGDTWIHGVATDPKKVSQFRALLRLRSRWLAEQRLDQNDDRFKSFNRSLLMIPEHTWGLDMKVHLGDYKAYNKRLFNTARQQENFRKLESSWEEQRAYLRNAVQALPPPYAHEAHLVLENTAPSLPDLSQFQVVTNPSTIFDTKFFKLRFNPKNGEIIFLNNNQTMRNWATPKHPIGTICYETFSQENYDRFIHQYIIHRRKDTEWATFDFSKPGIETAGARQSEWQPELRKICYCSNDRSEYFLLYLESAETAWREFGSPRTFITRVDLYKEQPVIEFDLQWFDKQANRLPEAIWFSFSPLALNPAGWKLKKLGQEISPFNVIRNGNRRLHAVNPGVSYQDERASLEIDSLDAALVAPGKRSLLNFTNHQPPIKMGMHFLLYNNLWGTNFPMWYDEDARYRFRLTF